METEELVFDHRSERQEIEKFSKALPDVGVAVLSAALVIEAINLSNLP